MMMAARPTTTANRGARAGPRPAVVRGGGGAGGRDGAAARAGAAAAVGESLSQGQQGGARPRLKKVKVAYQGVPGAYSEAAADMAYAACEALPCETFEKAFTSVERWAADRAVLPIENSLGGSIHRNYDLLFERELHIVGEVSLPVRHCLLARPGATIAGLKRVMSHPQALAQCENYLADIGVVKEEAIDTALCAKLIADGDDDTVAAVASRRAAELYGLDILDSDIQDDEDNVTRFIALARDPMSINAIVGDTGMGDEHAVPYKTSVVFTLDEGPGALFKALAVFALREVDLTKIESRPTPAGMMPIVETATGGERRFKYVFYVDFADAIASRNVQNALRHLEEIAPFVRVLGSYPRDMQLGKL